MENEKYIRAHPELDLVMRTFVKAVMQDRPKNVTAYAYHFFNRDVESLRQDIIKKT